MKKIKFALIPLFIAILFSLAACNPAPPETIVETVVVNTVETVVVTSEPAEEEIEQEEPECCRTYRIGIYGEPVSLNYWNYFGPSYFIWGEYVVSEDAAQLFELSDKQFKFVPALAKDIPTPEENQDGTWSILVEMVEDALWSDGEPISAEDVVFTHQVCKDFQLTGSWPSVCSPAGADVTVEAVDDFTVEYTYDGQPPSLSNWQFGVALAPILPEHFWSEVIEDAYEAIQTARPEEERPEDCGANSIAEELCAAWDAYDEALIAAREIIYNADAAGQPVAGPYITTDWERGEYIKRTINQNYYFAGAEIVAYEDGTWMRIMPDGTESQFYGQAEGDESLRYTVGPHNPEIEFSIYDSQESAFKAFIDGDVDYVLNPRVLPRNLKAQVEQTEGVQPYVNADYNMFYLAFNLNKPPMTDAAFRKVFDILIDREFLNREVLGDYVYPLHATMHPENTFWHNPELDGPYKGMSRSERLDLAVNVLMDAGWSWEQEPRWDESTEDIIPGVGLTMPDDEPMPALTILGPDQAHDPIRATYNLWIAEWARHLGMPIESELASRNNILDTILISSDYDMYIYGWRLGNKAFPGDYYQAYWHSRNCTIETGYYNTTCFKDEQYDQLVDDLMATADLEEAQALGYELQAILANQRPIIPLFSRKSYDFARHDVIFPYTDILGGIEGQLGFQAETQVLKE